MELRNVSAFGTSSLPLMVTKFELHKLCFNQCFGSKRLFLLSVLDEWKHDSKVEANAKHNDAYATDETDQDGEKPQANGHTKESNTKYQKLRGKYSPQEIALLCSLQHE